jgi:hypothetical protein
MKKNLFFLLNFFFICLRSNRIINAAQHISNPQEAYSELCKKLTYNPEVKSFHHVRRLHFEHNNEFGEFFFKNHPITCYIHGQQENADYAYQFSIENVTQNIFTFNFPISDKENNKNKVEIALCIARYIQLIY